jgi:hypothetical protein
MGERNFVDYVVMTRRLSQGHSALAPRPYERSTGYVHLPFFESDSLLSAGRCVMRLQMFFVVSVSSLLIGSVSTIRSRMFFWPCDSAAYSCWKNGRDS